ncbi:imelysin family protein [Fulvivirgaceae bacterium BMA10]|uniref:Imelysin family protein n=1 Tax=Splendidivirga corallicola TaxID=3051826 RepID=A0ABT8KX10_9BACT|nr:imelysin family protein [Fulvivirgaceae bacterium BMA10]
MLKLISDMKYFGMVIKTLLGIGIFASLAMVGSCSKDDEQIDRFDRKSLLRNIAQNQILTSYDIFGQEAMALSNTAIAFSKDISEANLNTLQDQWLKAAVAWKKAEIFNLGPVDQLLLKTSIDNWPTNTFTIEEAITNGSSINSEYIETLGSTSKGIPAIEYLLFDENNDKQNIINGFTDSQNRIDFLLALCENLVYIANTLYDAWEPTNGNYFNTFVNADGKDVGSSVNMLANELIFLTEIVKNQKLGIPLGKKSLGTPLPNNVEAKRSRASLSFIKENILSIEAVFLGGNSTGFDDYLDELDAKYLDDQMLSEAIKDQFSNVKTALNGIDNTLFDALTDDTIKVEAAYQELQKLVILLKTDMISSLGLLVTFSDNDGD